MHAIKYLNEWHSYHILACLAFLYLRRVSIFKGTQAANSDSLSFQTSSLFLSHSHSWFNARPVIQVVKGCARKFSFYPLNFCHFQDNLWSYQRRRERIKSFFFIPLYALPFLAWRAGLWGTQSDGCSVLFLPWADISETFIGTHAHTHSSRGGYSLACHKAEISFLALFPSVPSFLARAAIIQANKRALP